MNTIFSKIAITCTLLTLSYSALASFKIDDLKDRTNDIFNAKIIKNKKSYFLKLESTTYFDNNGNETLKNYSNFSKLYVFTKDILIPININITKINRNGGKFQFLGFGDDDFKTGTISNIKNLKTADLFTTYSGSSFNAGFGLFGGGYSKSKADNGATISDSNGSCLLPIPAGPIGINAGFEKVDFELTIETPFKAAEVSYVLSSPYENNEKTLTGNEVIAIDKILNADIVE